LAKGKNVVYHHPNISLKRIAQVRKIYHLIISFLSTENSEQIVVSCGDARIVYTFASAYWIL
jgi:hypothetical protein